MGTEMTPIASQEPSRTATPIRATTPAARSPISSGSSTPVRGQHGLQGNEGYQTGLAVTESRGETPGVVSATRHYGQEFNGSRIPENMDSDQARKMNALEARAMAWDEAERAKYMARCSTVTFTSARSLNLINSNFIYMNFMSLKLVAHHVYVGISVKR
jgi:hypothetical protein